MHPEDLDRASLTSRKIHSPHCYGCGLENPKGLHADFIFDDKIGEMRFSYKADSHLRGAPGRIHGGVLATILDEAQGVLCHNLGHMTMTHRLNIHYLRAVPVSSVIRVEARLTAVRRRRLYTIGEIYNSDGECAVTSRASWFILSDRYVKRMLSDLHSPDHVESILQTLEANRHRAREIRRNLRKSRLKPPADRRFSPVFRQTPIFIKKTISIPVDERPAAPYPLSHVTPDLENPSRPPRGSRRTQTKT